LNDVAELAGRFRLKGYDQNVPKARITMAQISSLSSAPAADFTGSGLLFGLFFDPGGSSSSLFFFDHMLLPSLLFIVCFAG
jgi:hypothetical protein